MVYDTFQQKAIDYIKEGCSVVVSAPTGAGKTAIAEYIIMDALLHHKRIIYTAPIKALSNQKFRDFNKQFRNQIGILTGDVTINPYAPILIMTTEIFRNKVLEGHPSLRDYTWVIFDEVHYLDDYERGTVWEEALIFLPHHMNILALSATIPNIDEFAGWLSCIHKKPFQVIKEHNRPVPLHFFYQIQNKISDSLSHLSLRYYNKHRQNRPTSLIRHLYKEDRLPCIYFAFSRRRCEYLAEEVSEFDFLNNEERDRIISTYKKLLIRFGLTEEKSAHDISHLIEKGVAFHHAGMLPTLKEVIEQLFSERLLKTIFTTETFALGINMPARSVVFDELRKFYGRHYTNLKTRDFYQMAGRAGRRGIDKEGFVYIRLNPRTISSQELQKIIYGVPEKVVSKFNTSYATILNLYQKYGENLYKVYNLSFHHFQTKKSGRKKAMDILYNKVRVLKELGYIEDNKLTDKGIFASTIYGYELGLSELYEKGILEKLSEIELGILTVGAVYEPKRHSIMPHLAKPARNLRIITDAIILQIHRIEKRFGITPLSKPYYYHLAPCIEAWMRHEPFEKLFRYTDTDEGEIIRYFRMAIQVLREILDAASPLSLKQKIHKTIPIINRDIIDAERQLRS